MEIPRKVGWRRLRLNNTQKFMLDVARLGKDASKPDKVERFIIFLEGLAPSSLWFKFKRRSLNLIMNAYWHIMPKRLYIYPALKPFVEESLPWFKEDPRSGYYRYLTADTFSGKKKIRINSLIATAYKKRQYVYSWKKAYHLCKQMEEEFRRQEHQYMVQKKLDEALKKHEVKDHG